MSAVRWLGLLIKINAVILMTAFVAVFLPESWMARIHEGIGMGEFPRGPLVGYLTRTVSGLYGLLGIATWILATDLRRYWPLVKLWGISCLLGGPIVAVIDWETQMPLYWTMFEGAYVTMMGAAVLLLQARAAKTLDDA